MATNSIWLDNFFLYFHMIHSLLIQPVSLLLLTLLVLALFLYQMKPRPPEHEWTDVECWFCQHHQKVPTPQATFWRCCACEQFNGFDSSGDYCRPIPAMWDSSPMLQPRRQFVVPRSFLSASNNVFCNACTRNQALKLEALKEFEEENEDEEDSSDSEEYQNRYRERMSQLEILYPLCPTCSARATQRVNQCNLAVLPQYVDWVRQRLPAPTKLPRVAHLLLLGHSPSQIRTFSFLTHRILCLVNAFIYFYFLTARPTILNDNSVVTPDLAAKARRCYLQAWVSTGAVVLAWLGRGARLGLVSCGAAWILFACCHRADLQEVAATWPVTMRVATFWLVGRVERWFNWMEASCLLLHVLIALVTHRPQVTVASVEDSTNTTAPEPSRDPSPVSLSPHSSSRSHPPPDCMRDEWPPAPLYRPKPAYSTTGIPHFKGINGGPHPKLVRASSVHLGTCASDTASLFSTKSRQSSGGAPLRFAENPWLPQREPTPGPSETWTRGPPSLSSKWSYNTAYPFEKFPRRHSLSPSLSTISSVSSRRSKKTSTYSPSTPPSSPPTPVARRGVSQVLWECLLGACLGFALTGVVVYLLLPVGVACFNWHFYGAPLSNIWLEEKDWV